MPPRLKLTRSALLQAAFQIARTQGIDAVTARSVAKEAGCSIQPVFSQFATMEALRQATFDYACERLMADILSFQDAPDYLPRISLWVVRLARDEPHLFHLLYLSNSYTDKDLFTYMMTYRSNRVALEKVAQAHGLEPEACGQIFLRAFLLVFGIATMIATNHMSFTDEQIASMMKQTVEDMARGTRERKGKDGSA